MYISPQPTLPVSVCACKGEGWESYFLNEFQEQEKNKKQKPFPATVADPTEQTIRSSIHFPLWLESSLVVMQGLLLLHTVSKLRLSTLESNSEKQKGENDNDTDQWETPASRYRSTFTALSSLLDFTSPSPLTSIQAVQYDGQGAICGPYFFLL